MKVLYDHQIFSSQVYGGISRYFYELFRHSPSHGCNPLINIRFSNNYYIHNLPGITPYYFFRNFDFKGKNRILEYINRSKTISSLKKNDFDLLHPTYYNPYFLNYMDKPFVVTVHDLIHEFYPDLPNAALETSNKKLLIEKSAHVIVPSQKTKSDLMALHKTPENKVSVIYHGRPEVDAVVDCKTIKLPEKYILFVGQRNYYKNFRILLDAFSLFFKEFSDYYLVCAGGGSFSIEDIQLFEQKKVTARVIQINMSDAELRQAYKMASCFVFPSDYEGFGIPVLEAFENECPTILSNSSCLPEIGGEAAIYFEKNNREDLLQQLKEVCKNREQRQKLIEYGKHRAIDFSWEKTAHQTAEIYKKIL